MLKVSLSVGSSDCLWECNIPLRCGGAGCKFNDMDLGSGGSPGVEHRNGVESETTTAARARGKQHQQHIQFNQQETNKKQNSGFRWWVLLSWKGEVTIAPQDATFAVGEDIKQESAGLVPSTTDATGFRGNVEKTESEFLVVSVLSLALLTRPSQNIILYAQHIRLYL